MVNAISSKPVPAGGSQRLYPLGLHELLATTTAFVPAYLILRLSRAKKIAQALAASSINRTIVGICVSQAL